jgi:hypothetical protein
MKLACANCGNVVDLDMADVLYTLDDNEMAEFIGAPYEPHAQEYVWCSNACCYVWLSAMSLEKGADLSVLVIDAYHTKTI